MQRYPGVQKERFGGVSPTTATATAAAAHTPITPTTMASPNTAAAQNRSASQRRRRTLTLRKLTGAASGAGSWAQRVNVLGKSRIIERPPTQRPRARGLGAGPSCDRSARACGGKCAAFTNVHTWAGLSVTRITVRLVLRAAVSASRAPTRRMLKRRRSAGDR